MRPGTASSSRMSWSTCPIRPASGGRGSCAAQDPRPPEAGRIGQVLQDMREDDAVPGLMHALVRRDVGRLDVQAELRTDEGGVLRVQLDALHLPAGLRGEPE